MKNTTRTYDVAVVGAGVFGAWAALCLADSGRRVVLLDQYGPANARASSGGESRILRAGYGPDVLYTRWAVRSLQLWQEFFAGSGTDLFHRCGVLWLSGEQDTHAKHSEEVLAKCGVAAERVERAELERRFPQFCFEGVDWGLFEPDSGALMARRAVQAVVTAAVNKGVDYLPASAIPPATRGRAAAMQISDGSSISADEYVFACGAWLAKVFLKLLGSRIFVTRQEVVFFGVPAGDLRFAAPAMPAWLFVTDGIYGLPELEHRGFKVALDRHGERVDPDTQSRVVSKESVQWMRGYVERRFPALRGAPIVETRVCQYENTWNGDFLIDRHPEMENVWLVGGGSGHGFKHGPALGEYVAAQVNGSGESEPRFSLASKRTMQKRAVY